MGPDTWGPVFWEFLHVAAGHADLQRKPQAVVDRIVDGFHASIPCPSCDDHFDDFRDENKLDVGPLVTNPTSNPSNQSEKTKDFPMLRWTVKAHNNVNKRNNKPLVDEDQVVDYFRKTGTLLNSKTKACQDSTSYYYYVCVVLGVLVVVVLGLLCLFAVRNAKLKTLLKRLKEEPSNKQRLGDTLRANKLGKP